MGWKKYEIIDIRVGFIVFNLQLFPGHFYFMRGHSLAELTEDDSAAEIMVHKYVRTYMYYLKKNQSTPRPSKHPSVMGKKCQNV